MPLHFSPFSWVKASHVATQAGFILCGACFAIWSALVPILQTRLGLEEAHLGLIILCLGAGSCCLMPFAGFFVRRWGCQQVLSFVFPLAFVLLVLVALANSIVMAVAVVALLGAALGTVDVVINIQAASLERREGKPLIAFFQAMYPVGGILGALYMHAGYLWNLQGWSAVIVFALGCCVLFSFILPHCLPKAQEAVAEQSHNTGWSSALKPGILLLGFFCFILFLAEGSVMDWSALYLRDVIKAPMSWGPFGYASLSAAILLMRLGSSWMLRRFGEEHVMLSGGIVCALAFFALWIEPNVHVVLACFFMVGLGYANLVPILFSRSSKVAPQNADAALSVISSLGYLGLLVGPALVGALAQAISLPFAYGCVGGLVLLVAAIDFYRVRREKKMRQEASKTDNEVTSASVRFSTVRAKFMAWKTHLFRSHPTSKEDTNRSN